jgi:hypothetical protein
MYNCIYDQKNLYTKFGKDKKKEKKLKINEKDE